MPVVMAAEMIATKEIAEAKAAVIPVVVIIVAEHSAKQSTRKQSTKDRGDVAEVKSAAITIAIVAVIVGIIAPAIAAILGTIAILWSVAISRLGTISIIAVIRTVPVIAIIGTISVVIASVPLVQPKKIAKDIAYVKARSAYDLWTRTLLVGTITLVVNLRLLIAGLTISLRYIPIYRIHG
jgi:hypothetical protein